MRRQLHQCGSTETSSPRPDVSPAAQGIFQLSPPGLGSDWLCLSIAVAWVSTPVALYSTPHPILKAMTREAPSGCQPAQSKSCSVPKIAAGESATPFSASGTGKFQREAAEKSRGRRDHGQAQIQRRGTSSLANRFVAQTTKSPMSRY